jgi:predicted nucleotidyltransferase
MNKWKEAVKDFIEDIRELYGEELEGIILYGSRARGDADEESDIDLLVVLKDFDDFWKEFRKISDLSSEVSYTYDVVLSAIPVKKKDYESKMSPLMLNVRREGIAIL